MRNDEDLYVASYDYDLPQELIATKPILPKENAKLLVYERAKQKLSHTFFGNLEQFLPPCAIVFNDTKVIKARIHGRKQSGAKIELLYHKALANGLFLVQIKGRVKPRDILEFDLNLKAEVVALSDDGFRQVRFFEPQKELSENELFLKLEKIGHVPLPPYIKRADEKSDETNYQSEFARYEGSIAAPTASLHFSKNQLKELALKHEIYTLTLHVGAGTFKSVEAEFLNEHKMHAERFFIDEKLIKLLRSDKPILGVGTTTTRVIENFARTQQKSGECTLFLHPHNPPLRQNYLLTNFHLPKSTLIMLVASFIGRKMTLKLYEEAVKRHYRFYSYGDAMLIL
ncbi:tRNA preQ1(34) S-adenosylmethionine ribosyltransferase-isomerase QueA [Campylobacter sp. MIT 12-8780]|uniref:tRNA preQ1(34) S-adenosylmethionine ribosyltransferase-isomerase QueA n=1 Tax=unclassified Campylobacter TaxID=2593542 RepID=UPI00115E0AFD|nr:MULTISPECIES: tRNA preQ1(34) S-adenosylmethionine ribosyltransferase-isomerase QueA [unclassified Campylobacter]NDJ27853.1 tRNA preQ1(34) S-adenosylmethionine ribosyltransferase-isomerase QueA [Campylobacter sp. MIT 19-121]TQR40596.1 tRNA preQ1(34) S-adenosylmethionine ribosyltransferase-isomerase QueA [Campylobacter sp. MIT 12-8780]